ncbi:MAG: hypothetical protein MZW92_44190 [Comamonadaceae bacterium]|nr:hypothetical protein [Comamonadaceae bacterium]
MIDGDARAARDRARARAGRGASTPPTGTRSPSCARTGCEAIDGYAAASARRDAARRARASPPRDASDPVGELLRRLAHAPQPRAGADVPLRTCCCSTSRPTTSTSTRCSGSRTGCARYPRHAAARHPRPRLPRSRRRRASCTSTAGGSSCYAGNYSRVRARARRRSSRVQQASLREAAAADRAPAGVRRPLPRQGDQGHARRRAG